MFRQRAEQSQADIGALFDERRDGGGGYRGHGGHSVPRFRRSEVTSSDHFEKRKLGRIVSKLSLVDRLEILEEREDHDDEEEDTEMIRGGLSRQDSGVSNVSTDTDHDKVSSAVSPSMAGNSVRYNIIPPLLSPCCVVASEQLISCEHCTREQ